MDTPLLVDTQWLAEHLSDPAVRVVDVRWYLNKPGAGRAAYAQGHIPGAQFMDIDGELTAPPERGPGRHPLPDPDVFAEAAGRAGIGPGVHVVAYDDVGGGVAARLWWLLRYFGHNAVSLLDGGLEQWIREALPLSTSTPQESPAVFTARPQAGWVVDKAWVQSHLGDPRVRLLDARARERYEGRTEPVDARAGHIPGAWSAPTADNLRGNGDWRFLPPEQLRAKYRALGPAPVEEVVAYCGSGVSACQTLFALLLAGLGTGLLYEGSWSDWSRDPTLPAATGDKP